MLKRIFLSTTIIFSILITTLLIGITTKANTIGQAAFDGPFTYEGLTTVTYKYFSSSADNNSNSTTKGLKSIDESKTVTVTEEQVLTYWLHTPINYDSSKSYPVWVFCSGSGCTIFEHENFNEINIVKVIDGGFELWENNERTATEKISSTTTSPYLSSYRQTVYYGNQFFICGYKDIEGNWTGSTTTPGGYDSNNAAILEQWYDLVYKKGKNEYDCFIIYVQPEDEAWWENSSNLETVCIHTMAQSKEICDKYGDKILTNSSGQYQSGYVASEITANPFSQLTVQFIDKLMETYSIDPKRQYLSGHSLGAQFSFDTMAHYPTRFAAAVFSGLPASDITEENAKNLTNMNIWTFNGDSDFCDKLFSIEFDKAVDSAKEKYGGIGITKATVCSGGHSGTYLNSNGTYVSGDKFSKGSTDIIDFLFNSSRIDVTTNETENDKETVKNTEVYAKASGVSEGTYDLALVSSCPTGEFDEYGFIVTPDDSATKVGYKSANFACEKCTKYTTSLKGQSVSIEATDYDAGYIFAKTISGIPNSISKFTVQAYASNNRGTTYGNKYVVTVNNGSVSVKEAN